jgi:hypothetical protein
MENQDQGELLPNVAIARRYGVDLRTIRRWEEDPDLHFPDPVVINNRKYRYRRDLEAWERKRAAARA